MIAEQELGQRLKKARKLRGITQKQLAEKAFLSKTTLQYYETGRSSPSALTLLQFCEILEVSPNKLLKWKEK